ncbi:hypothetical protein [Holophaga foetida]|uniref:hypothetical protein n=1 Tax=Holophaga foetida TaxID=35839 RepID=UPI0002472EC0|nr:hypothetical protein [Holophaga foetida]
MSWTEWIANQHTFFVHIPTAAAIFLPLPLIAAQRMGRGIRPWWLICRYLAIMGFLGLILTMISGYACVPNLSPLKGLVTAAGRSTSTVALVYHQFFGTLSLVLGIVTLMSMFRKRKDHESLGLLPFTFGILWAVAILLAHHYGTVIGRAEVAPRKVVTAPPPPAPVLRREDPEAKTPIRVLDYQRLIPIHTSPVKSKPHGDRWIRVWASPEAADAYRSGQALPEGALVVMSTVEDRWGRPGFEPGPLCALEVKGGKPALTYYWGQVPEARRSETGGAQQVYWRDSDPNLRSCMECHSQGMAPAKDRSQWGIPRPQRQGGTKP